MKIARLLIEKGAVVDIQHTRHFTPLMMAAWNGRVNMLHFLVEKGASLATKENIGRGLLCSLVRSFAIRSRACIKISRWC